MMIWRSSAHEPPRVMMHSDLTHVAHVVGCWWWLAEFPRAHGFAPPSISAPRCRRLPPHWPPAPLHGWWCHREDARAEGRHG
jgi:hypothetical protein